MSRLIDAEALEEGKFHGTEDWTPIECASWQWGWNDAIDAIISNAPTVDAVEVVRCKDCRCSSVIPKEMQNVGELFCEYWCAEMHDDDYCSCGKRGEDGKID